MLKKFLLVFSAAVTLVACAQNKPSTTDGKHFGATITPDGAMTYDDFLVKMTSDSMPAKIEGNISAVCQAKGCWMDFVSATDPSKPKMKVKFKDYAFFMPKDCAGKKAVVEGYAYTQTTSVEELKHLAGDAGKSQAEIDAITEPKKELRFMASGVVFVN